MYRKYVFYKNFIILQFKIKNRCKIIEYNDLLILMNFPRYPNFAILHIMLLLYRNFSPFFLTRSQNTTFTIELYFKLKPIQYFLSPLGFYLKETPTFIRTLFSLETKKNRSKEQDSVKLLLKAVVKHNPEPVYEKP